MKFKQFEFRLFPKIRNRKKKKAKLGHPDFPRDISLDKNCNLYKRDFPCFYDNLAAEANPVDHNPDYLLCSENTAVSDEQDSLHMKTLPLTELRINIENSCCCPQCACATDHVSSHQTTDTFLAGTCTGSSLGTPNTIPRTRTRIKTNPWLPSPRSTPSSSPTDQYQQLVAYQASSDQAGNPYMMRPSTLPLFSSCGAEYRTSMKTLTMPLNGLTEIPEHGHKEDEVNSILYCNGSFAEEEECQYRTITKHRRSPVCSLLKEDPNYETDISSCNSPVDEFLKCVRYEIDFAYEQTADDLLENSTFPRDDSFTSGINAHADIPEKELVNQTNKTASQIKLEEEIDLTFDDTNNNMQESIDTGYGSVSRDSDSMSSDEEFGIKTESRNDMKTINAVTRTQDNHSTESDEGMNRVNIHERANSDKSCNYSNIGHSIDIDHTSDIEQASDIDETSDIEQTSDTGRTSDLEWDDEPITQTLILEFPVVSNINGYKTTDMDSFITNNEDMFQSPIKRYGSVKYRRNIKDESECTCQRRRSRSLADIELSLDEKVILLREEKSFVQRKIHAAILEEKVREHQLKIFRLLSGDKRKQLIVKTLHDIKTRLEDQSARLQASYSTVISLQNMFSKRRRDLVLQETEG